jgi:hypothetical protein
MTDGIRLLTESSTELDHAEPGDSTKRAELLERCPFARKEIEEFLSQVECGKPLVAHAYDPAGGAVILMRAMSRSSKAELHKPDKTRVTISGFKNATRVQYDKFIAEADPIVLTGTTAIKLEAQRILSVQIP